MTEALLLHGHCRGLHASRQSAQACERPGQRPEPETPIVVCGCSGRISIPSWPSVGAAGDARRCLRAGAAALPGGEAGQARAHHGARHQAVGQCQPAGNRCAMAGCAGRRAETPPRGGGGGGISAEPSFSRPCRRSFVLRRVICAPRRAVVARCSADRTGSAIVGPPGQTALRAAAVEQDGGPSGYPTMRIGRCSLVLM